ncbi:MAG: class I SAM-dependent RNA methyltransferase [Archangium gephyra]|uniref:Class I SAM-dependent RNA methyltransferase n=1 Tax=Archangium gephyra TaxID=48 RepID=A0A2W5TP34_9BACT|nr:MAG: class I SAM-dependent RNA methyltransferase [Archangium gephyra]
MKLELRVERLSKSGDGVAPHEGRAVFVSGALPGERVLAEVEEQGKALRGEVLQVLEPSPSRRAPVCPVASTCGGCDWMHVQEDEQLRQKQEIVVSALEHVGGITRDAYELLPTVWSPNTVGYRRRAVLHPVGAALGFYGRRSHERVAVAKCPALTPTLADFPGRLATALGASTLKELEEVRLLECEGRVAISLHGKAQVRPRHRDALNAAIRDGLIDGAIFHPAEGKGAVEMFGRPVLDEEGVLHRPDGFAQANAEVNRRLVSQSIELLDVHGGERVLELYSGNGNFTFRLASHAEQVVAVESFPLSVALAQKAALKHGVANVRFVQGDSEKIAKGFVNERERFDRLLVDPPRSGAPGIGSWANGLLASRVVYVACDPTSLARDAKDLGEHGFRPIALQLFDLFPQSHHIEAVMAFTR